MGWRAVCLQHSFSNFSLAQGTSKPSNSFRELPFWAWALCGILLLLLSLSASSLVVSRRSVVSCVAHLFAQITCSLTTLRSSKITGMAGGAEMQGQPPTRPPTPTHPWAPLQPLWHTPLFRSVWAQRVSRCLQLRPRLRDSPETADIGGAIVMQSLSGMIDVCWRRPVLKVRVSCWGLCCHGPSRGPSLPA